VVPRSRRLLQAVERLVESAYQMRVHRVNVAGGLRAVDGLGECAVEEGILDVELVHGLTPGDSQSQHGPDGGRLDDGVEGLVVSLCLKIHLSVTTLPPGGRGTMSHVLLDSRDSYSSIARC
jgi:hypothetical protein